MFIKNYYRVFGGLPDDDDDSDNGHDGMDTDDEGLTPAATPQSMEFSFGTPGGLKRWY